MTSNPFDRHREAPRESASAVTDLELRRWCDEQNAKRITELMERWYYVTEKDGAPIVATLTGTDGGNVRKVIAGTLEDFVGWSPKRMDGYRRWLWGVAQAGMLEPMREAAA